MTDPRYTMAPDCDEAIGAVAGAGPVLSNRLAHLAGTAGEPDVPAKLGGGADGLRPGGAGAVGGARVGEGAVQCGLLPGAAGAVQPAGAAGDQPAGRVDALLLRGAGGSVPGGVLRAGACAAGRVGLVGGGVMQAPECLPDVGTMPVGDLVGLWARVLVQARGLSAAEVEAFAGCLVDAAGRVAGRGADPVDGGGGEPGAYLLRRR